MEPTPERELVVVLSDRISITVLAVTWVALLAAVVVLLRRTRALSARLDEA